MGMRSQIYIRIHDKNNNKILFAKYFQWNFGERMISRARYGIEYIKENLNYIDQTTVQKKINKIFDINFDMRDVMLSQDILEEVRNEIFRSSDNKNDYIFVSQDNNDGKLFIDCYQETGEIKFCFTDYDLKILSPSEYVKWDIGKTWDLPNFSSDKDWNEVVSICKNNIKYINKNAKMMTDTELEYFIKDDYSKQIGDSNFIKLLHDFNEKGTSKDSYNSFYIERIEHTDSWKLYSEYLEKFVMEYDSVSKKMTVDSYFKDTCEGMVQDAYNYYNLPYKNQVAELEKFTENDMNLQY